MRTLGLQAICLCLALLPSAMIYAQDEPAAVDESFVEVTPELEAAIEKGLAYLAKQQNEDGSFSAERFGGGHIGVTSICCLAFMANGQLPGRGEYGYVVEKGLEYVLAHAQESGLIASEHVSHGPMYGHGFATMYLAEVYGMSPRDDLREKLSSAVDLIVRTQNREGGWRYQPRPEDADISVTICQIMALRAARNAGLAVPRETVDKCIEYVKRCQNPDGGFNYLLQGGGSAFPRSAAGVVALYSAGLYEGEEIESGLQYLEQFPPRAGAGALLAGEGHFFYGQYYAVQAMWHAGPKRWNRWYPGIRNLLLERQQSNGAWQDPICSEYGTAMATIILQMPDNSVPIFQR